MSNILLVTSSLMGDASTSQRLAGEIVAGLRAQAPQGHVVQRHLTPDTMPHLTAATLQALSITADRRSSEQAQLVRAADAVIEEVEAADVIVIAAPMYNFSITSTLKAWIDHLARAGRTFRYTAAGPEGLLKGKTVVLVESRGGVYAGAGGTP
ncbi:MAG: NAD(P)H-dependent oxidoreductase, partial [Rhodospirillaceae bacterium]|nr:NAD(P)H-dependent oxidoreductase [Rhodospirillaceae bacterium]